MIFLQKQTQQIDLVDVMPKFTANEVYYQRHMSYMKTN